ncbi:Protein CBG00844 [Caenorhabditis briggsae]|uniref:Protein CBG00844 n=1 Tax=Caenorhabditis briggsae TaxID=6238 RepID=A8WPH3_CAEBR|nr:Protein CBG00844 [Caenorhabditis briggsae]CAP22380.1 Protein CBG00844 [Caenorhabditis briggsae]
MGAVLFYCHLVIYNSLRRLSLFPILLVYRIRLSHSSRITKIQQVTSTRQTMDEHIKKNVWN